MLPEIEYCLRMPMYFNEYYQRFIMCLIGYSVTIKFFDFWINTLNILSPVTGFIAFLFRVVSKCCKITNVHYIVFDEVIFTYKYRCC